MAFWISGRSAGGLSRTVRGQCTMPVRIAMATACARSFALSFSKMRSRWVFTVCGRDAEVAGDLPRGGAVGHLLQDLAFALGQGRGLGASGSPRRTSSMKVFVSWGWITALPSIALLRRVDQRVRRGVLQQVAGDPGLDRFGDGAAGLVDRDQDDLGGGCGLADAPRGLDAVHPGHADVHEHHVRGELAGTFHGFLAAGGLAHHDHDLVGEFECGAETFAGDRMVVHDEGSDRRHRRAAPSVRGSIPFGDVRWTL